VKHVDTIAELRTVLDAERAAGRRVGFVPTMGFLHEGHVSLMRAARAECDVVVTSIFVNPLQFAAHEDLDDYPRDLERDAALASGADVDLLFVPSVREMYPDPVAGGPLATAVSVAGVSDGMEGASRPTHFAGVATVVAKLFSIVGPCRAFFGEKDFQQLAVVRRMVADLSMPVDVVGCETVREPDGLAMSSRNAYLSAEQRAAAPVLHRALRAGVAVVLAGEPLGTEGGIRQRHQRVHRGRSLVGGEHVEAEGPGHVRDDGGARGEGGGHVGDVPVGDGEQHQACTGGHGRGVVVTAEGAVDPPAGAAQRGGQCAAGPAGPDDARVDSGHSLRFLRGSSPVRVPVGADDI
jgi:pantoate--beta-alanine ligase